jgi:PHD/YefM family antitoxin component YafN of YafNO toxin-antitoxin module
MRAAREYEALTLELYDLEDDALTEHIAAAKAAVARADSADRDM